MSDIFKFISLRAKHLHSLVLILLFLIEGVTDTIRGRNDSANNKYNLKDFIIVLQLVKLSLQFYISKINEFQK